MFMGYKTIRLLFNISRQMQHIKAATCAYSDDDDYRVCLLKAFGVIDLDLDVSDSSYYCFGGEFEKYLVDLERNMDAVFEVTKDVLEFHEVYRLAAALNFSERLDIGQAVLCSYDYFPMYHGMLLAFRYKDSDPYFDDQFRVAYDTLCKRLSK